MKNRNTEPPVKYIVFDLDKTVIFTSEKTSMETFSKSHILGDSFFFPVQDSLYMLELELDQGKGKHIHMEGGMRYNTTDSVEHMFGCVRPHARDFLRFCFEHFDAVIVWTAGIASYAVAICEALFKGLPKPHVIWSRGHCVLQTSSMTRISKDLIKSGDGIYPYIGRDHPEYDNIADMASVPDKESDIITVNAKPLDFMAKFLSDNAELFDNKEMFRGAKADNFMIVEDNYQSFIIKDTHRAFFIPAYEDPRPNMNSNPDDNKLGTPGYSPFKNNKQRSVFETEQEYHDFIASCSDLPVSVDYINEFITKKFKYIRDKDKQKADTEEAPYSTSALTYPVHPSVDKCLYYRLSFNWLLRDDQTLPRLRDMLKRNPNKSARFLSNAWNKEQSSLHTVKEELVIKEPKCSDISSSIEEIHGDGNLVIVGNNNTIIMRAPKMEVQNNDNDDVPVESLNLDDKIATRIIERTKKSLVFEVRGIDETVATTLKGIMTSRIPTVAIDRVIIFHNTSMVSNERLAQILGLIPLDISPQTQEQYRFSLRVSNQSDEIAVITSADLVCESDLSIRPLYEDIILANLKKGQSISLECTTRISTGAEHAKFSPVSPASYRQTGTNQFIFSVESESTYAAEDIVRTAYRMFSEGENIVSA